MTCAFAVAAMAVSVESGRSFFVLFQVVTSIPADMSLSAQRVPMIPSPMIATLYFGCSFISLHHSSFYLCQSCIGFLLDSVAY